MWRESFVRMVRMHRPRSLSGERWSRASHLGLRSFPYRRFAMPRTRISNLYVFFLHLLLPLLLLLRFLQNSELYSQRLSRGLPARRLHLRHPHPCSALPLTQQLPEKMRRLEQKHRESDRPCGRRGNRVPAADQRCPWFVKPNRLERVRNPCSEACLCRQPFYTSTFAQHLRS